MSYVHAESATLNAAASNYVIASDAYVANPDYKILTMSGAGVIYSGMTVISGGTAQLAASAVLADTTIGAGGSLTREGELFLSNVTFESGAIGSATYLSGCTLNTGAKVTVPGGLVIAGIGNSIAQNTLVGGPGNIGNLYTVNGVIYGINNVGGAITFADGIIVSGGNVGGYKYFTRGAQGRDLTANTTNNGPGLGDGGYLYNVKVTNGSVYVNENTLTSAPSISLGGAETVIPVGHFEVGTATLGKVINAIYAEGGKLYGVDLHTGRYTDATRPYYWMDKLTILEGLIIDSPVVSSGGSLTIGSGGSGNGIVTSANAYLYVIDGGKATNIDMKGGWLTIDNNGKVDGAAINIGATAANPAKVMQGTLENYTLTAGVVSGYNGAVISGGSIGGTAQILLRGTDGGATIRDLTQLNGTVIVNEVGNYASDVKVSGGRFYVQNSAEASDIYIFSGGRIDINSGVHASNIRVSGGGLLYINQMAASYNNAVVDNITLLTGAALAIYRGTVNGLTVSTGASTAKHAYFYTGAVVNDLTIYGNSNSGQYDVIVSSGAVVNRATHSGGGLWVYQNGRVNDLQVAKGETIFQDAGYGSSVKVSGGYLYVRSQALIENLSMTGGNARFQGGTIRNATFTGNIGMLDFSPGFTLESAVFSNLTSAGNSANANAANLNSVTVSTGATLNISAGAADNLLASGGTINISGGATANNVTVDQAGALLNVNGATVNSLNVFNSTAGILCNLSNGATVNNIVASGQKNGNTILRAYDNVTMSGITLTSGNIWYYGANIKAYDLHLSNGQFIVQSEGGYLSGARVSAGHLYARATVEDVTQIGGSTLLDNASGSVSNFMLSGGNLSIGAGGSGTDITVRGGNVSVINGVASKLTISGGVVSGYADATLTSVTVSSGGSITATGGIINNLSAFNPRAGVLGQFINTEINNVYASGAGVGTTVLELRGGATMNNIALVTGDIWYYNANNRGSNLVERNGEFIVQSEGGYFSGATILGGHLYAWKNGLIEGVVQSGGYLHVATDGEMRGVVMSNMADSNVIGQGKLTDFTLLKGIVSGASMAVLSGGIIDGGEVRLRDVNGGAKLEDVTILTKSAIVDQVGNLVSNARVSGGILYVQYGASGSDIDLYTGAKLHINQNASGANIRISGGTLVLNEASAQSGGSTTDVTMYDGEIKVQYGATISDVAVSGGKLTVNAGTTANAVTIGEDGSATVAGTLDVADSAWNVTVNNGGTVNVASGMTVVDIKTNAGAHVDVVRDENRATIAGDKTNIAASTFFYAGSANALGMSVVNGVVKNLGADGNYYRLAFGSGITIEDATVNNGWRISALNEAVVSGGLTYGNGGTAVTVMRDNSHVVGMTLSATASTVSGLLNVWDQATTEDIIVSNGGILRLQSADNKATGTVVYNGGLIDLVQAASIEDTTLKAGGKLTLIAGTDTGRLLTLDFTAGGSSVTINNLGLVSSDTRIAVQGLAIGTTYTIATTGATDRYVCCDAAGLYDNAVQGGTTYTNAFAGKTWNFSTGKSIAVTEFSIGEAKATAGAITTADTALNTNDRAAKWDATTSYTDSVTLADSTLAGDAWLEIDGTNVSTALYGASGNYAHTVNIEAKSGEIRNLAAGAANGGSVAGVKLTLDGADVTGAAYAGGFGNVTGKTETLISDGSFTKDFYAGTLANYAKTSTVTTVGDIAMTVDGGTFSGNIYGASAVKASVANAHTAGDVTLTVTGGATTKGTQSCIFAGGYATGTAANTTVYTVDSVTATISGGNWGAAAGGRGVFGGIFASGVEAQVIGDVNITVSGDATMGNVYGGGWAQKTGAKSIVGDVRINIAGGTVTNVFGGGSHSTSGGTTETGDVTITVSGGNITGAIYARGQLEGDTTGAASVIFTGATDFACDVYGYSYVGGAASDANLSYTDYTGEFSGNIGGFNGIKFDGATAMEFTAAAADVSNGAWEFDLTDRASALAGTSLLTWSSASFVDDTIKVTFADEAQAKGDWNIATVAEAFSGTTFDVKVGDSEIATGLAYNQQIASGDYAGWGFELESGVLKFKQLA